MSQTPYAQNLLIWVKKQGAAIKNQLVIGQKSMSIFILKMYLHDRLVQKSTYQLKEHSVYPQLTDNLSQFCEITKSHHSNKYEDKLLSLLTMVDQDDIFDTICIREDLHTIITLLIECSDKKAFKEQPRLVQENKQYSVQDASWFDRQAPQPCVYWIINEFEKQITLLYYKHINYVNHEYLMSYWMNNTNNIRTKVINAIPQVTKSKKKNNVIQYSQLIENNRIDQKEILDKFNNNELESIFYLPIQNTLLLQSLCEKQLLKMIKENYKQSILKELESVKDNEQKISASKLKKKKKQNKQKKLITQVAQESKSDTGFHQNEEEHQVTTDDTEDTEEWIIITGNNKKQVKKYQSDSDNQQPQQDFAFVQEPIKPEEQQISQSATQMEIEDQFQEQTDQGSPSKVTSESNSNQSSAEKKKLSKKSLVLPKKEEQSFEILDSSIMDQAYLSMIKKLDMDMKEFTEHIMRGNEAQFPIRQLIFNRLQFIIQMLFQEANIRLFGSCATGLALQDSDIDIGITGFEMCQIQKRMEIIIECLSKMNWIKKIKYHIFLSRPIYPTLTTLPLIKLIVDPSVPFRNGNINAPPIDCLCDSQLIQVDISFFDHFQHLGLTSTEMTCYWLSIYQELRPITLLFKSLLKRRGLNDQSRGGISSFCIVLMVVSFLEHYYQQESQFHSIGLTTYKFLEFYGMKFDPCSQGIFYKGFDQSPYFQLDKQDLQLTIVSPITYEVASQSSSFVQTILQDINVLFLACENETQFFYEKMKFNKKKRGKKEDRNLFYKEFAKLNPLFST